MTKAQSQRKAWPPTLASYPLPLLYLPVGKAGHRVSSEPWCWVQGRERRALGCSSGPTVSLLPSHPTSSTTAAPMSPWACPGQADRRQAPSMSVTRSRQHPSLGTQEHHRAALYRAEGPSSQHQLGFPARPVLCSGFGFSTWSVSGLGRVYPNVAWRNALWPPHPPAAPSPPCGLRLQPYPPLHPPPGETGTHKTESGGTGEKLG